MSFLVGPAQMLSHMRVGYAQIPTRPMLVTGTITLNGNPAPDGLTLIAKINGVEAGSTTTSGGQYTLVVNATMGDSTTGQTVNFVLGGLSTSQTVTFDNTSNGGVQTLDLAFTGTPTTGMATTTQVQTTQTSTTQVSTTPSTGTTSTTTEATSSQSTTNSSSSSSATSSVTSSTSRRKSRLKVHL